MPRLRRALTYANVMATVAVFLALGGSAYAAGLLTGKQIQDGSLYGVDIADNSVGSVDVKNGDLLAEDFKAGELLAGPKGDTGPQGPAGADGATGPQGPAGTNGTSTLDTFWVQQYVASPGTVGTRSGTAFCPSGSEVTGGGYLASYGGDQTVVADRPSYSGNGWYVEIMATGGLYVYAVCARVS